MRCENDGLRWGKALFAIKSIIEEEMLEHIRYATVSKGAWDILDARFLKKNDMRLQLIENDLLIVKHGYLGINNFFT